MDAGAKGERFEGCAEVDRRNASWNAIIEERISGLDNECPQVLLLQTAASSRGNNTLGAQWWALYAERKADHRLGNVDLQISPLPELELVDFILELINIPVRESRS